MHTADGAENAPVRALSGEAETVMTAVLASRKYAAICPALVARICAEETPKYRQEKQRVQAAKNRLHQIYGAFLQGEALRRAEKELAALERGETGLREASRAVLALHTSMAERLPALPALYSFLREQLGGITSVQDIGCGLHPFGLPTLACPALTAYHAYDIDLRQVALINRFLVCAGLAPLAQTLDAVAAVPDAVTDAAFLMKLLPVLEAQRRGRAQAILRDVRAHRLVVTFPTKSLGGREKGMAASYAAAFEAGLDDTLRIDARQVFGSELVYVLTKRATQD